MSMDFFGQLPGPTWVSKCLHLQDENYFAQNVALGNDRGKLVASLAAWLNIIPQSSI